MAKARVYELAKELGVGNKEILEQLKKKNVEVKNHMSTVEDNVAEEIRRENAGRNEEPAKAEPAAEKAAEKDSGVPKKKNLAFVVRPQNSRNSSRLQGNKRPGANQGRSTAQEMHAEERTVRYVQQVQRENQCVQREQLRQVRVRRKLTGQREPYAQKNRLRQREPYAQRDRLRQREWYAQKDRLRQQDVPAEREDRYVRREMKDHSVQAVTERTVRFVTAVMGEADV